MGKFSTLAVLTVAAVGISACGGAAHAAPSPACVQFTEAHAVFEAATPTDRHGEIDALRALWDVTTKSVKESNGETAAVLDGVSAALTTAAIHEGETEQLEVAISSALAHCAA